MNSIIYIMDVVGRYVFVGPVEFCGYEFLVG